MRYMMMVMVMACVPDVVIGRPRNFAQSRMSASITSSTIRPPLRGRTKSGSTTFARCGMSCVLT